MGQGAIPGRILLSYTSEFRNRFDLTTSAKKRAAVNSTPGSSWHISTFILINSICHFGDAFSFLFLSIHDLCLLGMNCILAITKGNCDCIYCSLCIISSGKTFVLKEQGISACEHTITTFVRENICRENQPNVDLSVYNFSHFIYLGLISIFSLSSLSQACSFYEVIVFIFKPIWVKYSVRCLEAMY